MQDERRRGVKRREAQRARELRRASKRRSAWRGQEGSRSAMRNKGSFERTGRQREEE